MRTPTVRSLFGAGAAAGVLALAASGLPAWAADPLECGDQVTSSVTLTADLTCDGGGDGLVIAADGVVLDLGGHTISGAGAYGAGSGAGVRVAERQDVTVRNGTIRAFAAGLEIQQSQRVWVSGLDISDGDRGVNVGGGGSHLIEKNVIHDNGRDAVRIAVSAGNRVSKNTISGNVFGIGVADGSTGTVVEKNVAVGNGEFGAAAYSGARGTAFLKNIIRGTAKDGLLVTADTSATLLEKNEVSGSGDDGIDVDTVDATLTKNIVVGNADLGIEALDGVRGSGNLASGNGNALQCTGVVCRPVT